MASIEMLFFQATTTEKALKEENVTHEEQMEMLKKKHDYVVDEGLKDVYDDFKNIVDQV